MGITLGAIIEWRKDIVEARHFQKIIEEAHTVTLPNSFVFESLSTLPLILQRRQEM